MVLFICGLTMAINNLTYIKQSSKKYINVLLIIIGILLSIYSGVILYLIFAFQNASF